jgi:DNA-binding CsgD family transcriptional regulator
VGTFAREGGLTVICWSIDSWHSLNDSGKNAGHLWTFRPQADCTIGESMQKPNSKSQAKPIGLAARRRIPKEPLSEREIEVARLISLGCSVYEAAAILQLASSTVDNYKTGAMKKLGTSKAVLLTRAVIKAGISSLNDRLTSAERRRLRRMPR